MRKTLLAAAVLAGVTAVSLSLTAAVSPEPPLEGAWIVTGWESGGKALATPQRGLVIFTDDHYSMMYVNGDTPRATYAGESITDSEILAAYRSFIANSGRYELKGTVLTTRAFMAKDPNYMAAWEDSCIREACKNDLVYGIALKGDELRLTLPAALGATAQVAILPRVE